MMNKNYLSPKWLVLIGIFISGTIGAWGVWGHKHINKAAVFALPEEMRVFFYNHIDFVTEESVVPDIRKYTIHDQQEPNRHFIDLEAFNGKSVDSLPLMMEGATKQYDSIFLQKNGILPWYMFQMTEKLTKAFKNKNKTEILFLAADLGHYIGDAHMPLHTSLNYDGQLSGQKGIHSFWETALPELFGKDYHLYVPDAIYITDVNAEIRRMIAHTHTLVDSVLLIEKRVSQTFNKDDIYKKDEAGKIIKTRFGQSIHSEAYAKAYHDAMKGMVESQMKLSVSAVANFWYTAWVNAGKPDLSGLDSDELTKRNKKFLTKELKAFKEGKLLYLEKSSD